MRLLYDLRLVQLHPEPRGIANYCRHLLKELRNHSLDITVLLRSGMTAPPEAADLPVLEVPACPVRTSRLNWLWDNLLVRVWRQLDFDLVHFTCPLTLISGWNQHSLRVPYVATVFDLQALKPGVLKGHSRLTLPIYQYQTFRLRRATRLLSISHFTKGEVQKYLGRRCPPIAVTPLGGDDYAAPRVPMDLAQRWSISRPYLLSYPVWPSHKNVEALLTAMIQLGDRAPVLVLAGAAPEAYLQRLRQLAQSLPVLVLGPVSENERRELLAQAHGFIFPSLMEGFGLPVLEALRAGLPVATSNAASLPEVGGDAAIYFDGRNQSEIAAAVLAIMESGEVREKRVALSLRQAARLTWAETARLTVEQYRQAISGCRL